MRTLLVFFGRIKGIFIAVGGVLFLSGYIYLIFYLVNKYPQNEEGVVVGMVTGIVLIFPATYGAIQLIKWVKKQWEEAQEETNPKPQITAEALEQKASLCLDISHRMLPGAKEEIIVAQAEALMHLSDRYLTGTLKRLKDTGKTEDIEEKKEPEKLLSRYDIARQQNV